MGGKVGLPDGPPRKVRLSVGQHACAPHCAVPTLGEGRKYAHARGGAPRLRRWDSVRVVGTPNGLLGQRIRGVRHYPPRRRSGPKPGVNNDRANALLQER